MLNKRRTQSIGQYESSLKTYQEALDSLPPADKMTRVHLSLKRQCEEDMEVVKKKMAAAPLAELLFDLSIKEKMPWKRVWSMREELWAEMPPRPTSVRILLLRILS